jgi:hypothetical protein
VPLLEIEVALTIVYDGTQCTMVEFRKIRQGRYARVSPALRTDMASPKGASSRHLTMFIQLFIFRLLKVGLVCISIKAKNYERVRKRAAAKYGEYRMLLLAKRGEDRVRAQVS